MFFSTISLFKSMSDNLDLSVKTPYKLFNYLSSSTKINFKKFYKKAGL